MKTECRINQRFLKGASFICGGYMRCTWKKQVVEMDGCEKHSSFNERQSGYLYTIYVMIIEKSVDILYDASYNKTMKSNGASQKEVPFFYPSG